MYNTGKVPDIDIVDEVGGFTASISSVHEKSVNATKKQPIIFTGFIITIILGIKAICMWRPYLTMEIYFRRKVPPCRQMP